MSKICISILMTVIISGCTSLGGFVKSSNPEKKFIDISGFIDEQFRYKINVEYRSTAKLKQCTNYQIALGKDVAQEYVASYYPEINGNNHYIRVPLQEVAPNTVCKWKPVMAFLCIGYPGQEPTGCTSVFSFRGVQDIDPITTMECAESGFCYNSNSNFGSGAINKFNRTYKLDVVAKQTY